MLRGAEGGRKRRAEDMADPADPQSCMSHTPQWDAYAACGAATAGHNSTARNTTAFVLTTTAFAAPRLRTALS